MKYFKKFFSSLLLLLVVLLCTKKLIVFGSSTTETYLEDFVADKYEYFIFGEGDENTICYLIEGVTESYMLYDYQNNELIFYCSNARSPWTLYQNNLFDSYGLYYSSTDGYCIVNLEAEGIRDYGDVVNIEGDMEIYKTTDTDLADMYSNLDSIPLDIDFAELFPLSNVVENVEIPNAYYFKNLNTNVPKNLYGTCTTISFSMLMGYLDTFCNDDLISSEYIEKEEVYNHYAQNTISSPGAEGYYYYLMENIAPQTLTYNEYYFNDDSPWYSQLSVQLKSDFDTINSQMINILRNDPASVLNNSFDYYKHSTNKDSNNSSNLFVEFEELIREGYPVVVDIVNSMDDNDNIYYVNYKSGNEEWAEMIEDDGTPGAHSFVCYGYMKVRENDPYTNQEKIVTYYKGHGGQKKDNGSYNYANSLYTNRYMYNGITENPLYEISGYTFIPKNNYHKCSKNYIYNNGTCSFGICPCDSKLSTREFFSKYCNVSLVNGKNKYYCKEHGTHLLYEETHTHNYDVTYDEHNHTYSCSDYGCSQSYTQNHNIYCETFDGHHSCYCSLCEYSYLNEPSVYEIITEQNHVYYCDVCNKYISLSHQLKYEYINNTLHRRYCELCEYSEIVPHDAYDNVIYEFDQGDGTIVKYCPCCKEYIE